MDNIKILYFIIAVIIFIVSRVRKANKNKPPAPRRNNRPSNPTSPQGEEQVPTSLEEMLEELGKSMEKNNPQKRSSPTLASKPKPVPVKQEPTYQSGVDRRFADDESRRIYEESIHRAEGFDIDFNENSNFKSKRTVFGEGAVKSDIHKPNPLIAALKEDLKNPNSVKKAFILSEVFNRKY